MIPDISFNANDSNFTSFECATEDEVLKLLNRSPTKSCNLDPVPTNLLKDYSHVILPVITKIINQSLYSGIFPSTFKTALIRPLLKKPSLDHEILKNYRPVSNPPFLSKLLERIALSRILPFLRTNNILDHHQSAYRSNHSIETALLKVENDILSAMDRVDLLLLSSLICQLLTLWIIVSTQASSATWI